MKNIIKKIISICLSFVLIFSIVGFVTKNIEYNTYEVSAAETKDKQKKAANESKNKNDKKDEIKDEIEAQKQTHKKEAIAAGVINGLSALYNLYNSHIEGEPDTMGFIFDLVDTAISVGLSYFGLSTFSDAAIDLLDQFFAGDQPLSEVKILEDNMNSQFNEVKDQLSDLHEEVNNLSLQMDESTNKILNELTNSLNNLDAKQQVRTFMNSGEGNFSYTMFKNYLYGSTNNSNLYKGQAYYMSLVESIINGDSDAIIKEKYDKLYNCINGVNDRDISNLQLLYEYSFGGSEPGTNKSIVQYYYDYLKANPELVKESSPEVEAIMFAYDIYSTTNKANYLIQLCNNYQKMELLKYCVENNISIESLETDESIRYYYSDNNYTSHTIHPAVYLIPTPSSL